MLKLIKGKMKTQQYFNNCPNKANRCIQVHLLFVSIVPHKVAITVPFHGRSSNIRYFLHASILARSGAGYNPMTGH